jgi:cytoskeletal protein CcmA (bactofilin family)
MFQRPSPNIALSQDERSHVDDDVETVVGPSVHVEGDFASEGNILVKGMVSGNVKTSRLLTVEQGAKIMANVKAGNAVISGEIKGNVKVDDRLEVTESARIIGDISCTILEVNAGAMLLGKISMSGLKGEIKSTKKRTLGRIKVKKTNQSEEELSEEATEENE